MSGWSDESLVSGIRGQDKSLLERRRPAVGLRSQISMVTCPSSGDGRMRRAGARGAAWLMNAAEASACAHPTLTKQPERLGSTTWQPDCSPADSPSERARTRQNSNTHKERCQRGSGVVGRRVSHSDARCRQDFANCVDTARGASAGSGADFGSASLRHSSASICKHCEGVWRGDGGRCTRTRTQGAVRAHESMNESRSCSLSRAPCVDAARERDALALSLSLPPASLYYISCLSLLRRGLLAKSSRFQFPRVLFPAVIAFFQLVKKSRGT